MIIKRADVSHTYMRVRGNLPFHHDYTQHEKVARLRIISNFGVLLLTVLFQKVCTKLWKALMMSLTHLALLWCGCNLLSRTSLWRSYVWWGGRERKVEWENNEKLREIWWHSPRIVYAVEHATYFYRKLDRYSEHSPEPLFFRVFYSNVKICRRMENQLTTLRLFFCWWQISQLLAYTLLLASWEEQKILKWGKIRKSLKYYFFQFFSILWYSFMNPTNSLDIYFKNIIFKDSHRWKCQQCGNNKLWHLIRGLKWFEKEKEKTVKEWMGRRLCVLEDAETKGGKSFLFNFLSALFFVAVRRSLWFQLKSSVRWTMKAVATCHDCLSSSLSRSNQSWIIIIREMSVIRKRRQMTRFLWTKAFFPLKLETVCWIEVEELRWGEIIYVSA